MTEERPLLILDLDETLVHASDAPLSRAPDYRVGPYALYLRPGLREFIGNVESHYRLAVWTSSSPMYADAVCGIVFQAPSRLEFVWASDRCTLRRDFENDGWCKAKPLQKVKRRGYDLRRVLVVDDSPEKHTRNYGNLVRVTPFVGDPEDDELHQLGLYLKELSQEPDMRRIEKRGWRRRMAVPAMLLP